MSMDDYQRQALEDIATDSMNAGGDTALREAWVAALADLAVDDDFGEWLRQYAIARIERRMESAE